MVRTSKGQERQAEILQLARQLIQDEGIDGFVLRRIADQAGMKLGNLQYYYATRDDLLEALLRSEFERDLAALQPPEPRPTTQAETEANFLAAIDSLTSRWSEDSGSVYLPIGVLAHTEQRFCDLWEEIYNAFYAAMARLIRQLDPAATPSQARSRAILVTALIDGSSVQVFKASGASGKAAMGKAFRTQALRIAKGD